MRTLTRSVALSLMLLGCTNGNKDTDTDTQVITDDTFDTAFVIGEDGDSSFETANDVTGGSFNNIDVDADFLGYLLVGEGIIAPEGDRDFYELTLNEGVTYSFATLAFALTQRVVLDTVIRVYDANQNLIAENDDMPFRFLETDSAVVFTAPATGNYYLEVLDFGDWYIETTGDDLGGQVSPDGGIDFEYQLIGAILPNNEIDPNDRLLDVIIGETSLIDTAVPDDSGDTAEDTDADTDVTEDDTGFVNLTSDYYIPSFFAGYSSDFVGNFSSADDVDYWPIQVTLQNETEGDFAYLAISSWPNAAEGTTVSVVDSDGNLLASTDELEANSDYDLWFDDVGLLTKVDRDDVVYMKFEGAESATYPSMSFVYLPTLGDPEDEDGGNNSLEDNNIVPIEEQENNPGVYTASLWGEIPASDADGDWFRLIGADVGGLDGKYVNVWTKASEIGSALDPKITFYDAEGNMLQEWTGDAEFDDSLDPNVRDYVAGEGDLYIHIEAESTGEGERSNQYIMAVIVTDGNVFN
jgi:hypothetical protein